MNSCPCGISPEQCTYHNSTAKAAELSSDVDGEVECLNCGWIGDLLIDGYCDACICAECGANAGETGCSMNDDGWCDDCVADLQDP